MTTIYQDSAGILYLGKLNIPNDISTFRTDLKALFETNPQNSTFTDGRDEYFSFNGEPVSSSEFHIRIDKFKNGNGQMKTSASSSGPGYATGISTFANPLRGTYAVFGKGVLAWFVDVPPVGALFMIGEAEVSAFPSPRNRFVLDNIKNEGFWVKQEDSVGLSELYVDEPQASFSINCSGGGTADATWLKLLDKGTGKVAVVCEGTVMQTEGTNFQVGEFGEVDAPLPDGGSRIFLCVGPWGDDGQVLMRIAGISATQF